MTTARNYLVHVRLINGRLATIQYIGATPSKARSKAMMRQDVDAVLRIEEVAG